MLEFKVLASNLLQTGDPVSTKSLWRKHGTADSSTDWDTTATTIGNSSTCGTAGASNDLDTRATAGDLYRVNSNIRIVAMNTGAKIDIPIRFYKSKNFVTSC